MKFWNLDDDPCCDKGCLLAIIVVLWTLIFKEQLTQCITYTSVMA